MHFPKAEPLVLLYRIIITRNQKKIILVLHQICDNPFITIFEKCLRENHNYLLNLLSVRFLTKVILLRTEASVNL